MVAASRAKSSDRTAILKKLLPGIKKNYKITLPKNDRPVLETMLYAICLEDVSVEEADQAYESLFREFPDLNEVRVSSISEIERAFAGMPKSEWRSFHVRNVLQYVFEKSFAFEFESLRKKTLELAQKQLAKIKSLPEFVRNYTLQSIIGAHLIPIDDAMARALVWTGLAAPNQHVDQMSETLKTVVRKADVLQFCFSIRCLATDRKIQGAFNPEKNPPPAEGYDGADVMERLTEVYKGPSAKPKAKAKAAEPKPVDEKPSKTKAAAKEAKVEKPTKKKAEPSKPASTKAAAKKSEPAPAKKAAKASSVAGATKKAAKKAK